MASCNLALILKSGLNDEEFILLKQPSPPKFGEEEYDSFVDSDLWDLPSTQLDILEGESVSGVSVQGAEACLPEVDLSKFDVESALSRVLGQVGLGCTDAGEWLFLKHVKEPEFGPGLPLSTVFITGKLLIGDLDLREGCKSMSIQMCLNLLREVQPSSDRVGPLIVLSLVNESLKGAECNVPHSLRCQEYPPGVMLVPMQSRTMKPFNTTNLVIFAPEIVSEVYEGCEYVAYGDALIVDPGCRTALHEELREIVAGLPKKLIVFVTHHHHDHVDGLSIVQRYRPDAILLAHKNTMRRIGKDVWSGGYTSICGGEDICVGGQRLSAIFSPGHTDGHVALLHVSTHSLIVGDHCVGQGSVVLDITSGGNMAEYFQSTYKFLDLSPHVLIPMHGRVNLWPKYMLCGYLKNRREREASILQAIETGANTLFDIVAKVYSEVNRGFWISASSNVRLHVEHLSHENKLPAGFSLENFNSSVVAFTGMVGKI